MTLHDAAGRDRIARNDTSVATLETSVAIDRQLAGLDLAGRLALAASLGHGVFTTSLGIEDQVITAAIGTHRLPIEVSTLQTGRLFAETLALIAETEERYDLSIRRFEPDQNDIDAYAAKYGLNGFYDSVEGRHACCHVRKLVPLAKRCRRRRVDHRASPWPVRQSRHDAVCRI